MAVSSSCAESLDLQPREHIKISNIAGQQRIAMVDCCGGDQRIVRSSRYAFWQRCNHTRMGPGDWY